VRIIIDIQLGKDGRPSGTIRLADGTDEQSFSGNLEFLELLQGAYQGATTPSRTNANGFEGNTS
jgi:hypothetical protein